mmetsp:Transcript_32552/g.49810  ORF Transcript_32552/g.49810 Transcript_32552/m.49810 type:complete len:243 (+) Transcript_32552:152-880(+)
MMIRSVCPIESTTNGSFFICIFTFLEIFWKTSVLLQALKLLLQVLHIIRKTGKSSSLLFTSLHSCHYLGLSITETPPHSSENHHQTNQQSNEYSKNSESNGPLFIKLRKSKEHQWNQQKHHSDVHQWESTPDTSCLSELSSSMKRNSTHEWEWVPDEDSSNVEEQVTKSNLQRINTIRHQSRHQCSERCSNVSTKSQWQHLVQWKNSHSNQRSQCRCGDGRRLNEDGESGSNDNCKIPVDVC